MNLRISRWLAVALLAAVLLSSCTSTPPPPQELGAIETQAFEFVLTQSAFQQTQTQAAIPQAPPSTNTPAATITLAAIPTVAVFAGTNTPFAFNTQQPGLTPLGLASPTATAGPYSTVTTKNGCNDGYMISESQPYDGKTIKKGTEFTKSWEFINTGTCAWDEGYTFAFIREFSNGPYWSRDYVIPKNGPFTKPGETRVFTVTLQAPGKPGEYSWYFKLRDDAGNYFGSLVWTTIISVEN
jgi:hypothetical protein